MGINEMELNTFTLELPGSGGTGNVTFQCGQSVVIIGANGSGKTRLGTWIEFQSAQKIRVHRISAQKSLTMPEFSSTSSLEKSEGDLLSGYWEKTHQGNSSVVESWKTSNRWGQKPNTFLL
ncbi:MAG: hypothetical protein KY445_14135 [Armatimonadetes bacterium]|nr:hypothetical protein [Armatimonadota bacterium]